MIEWPLVIVACLIASLAGGAVVALIVKQGPEGPQGETGPPGPCGMTGAPGRDAEPPPPSREFVGDTFIKTAWVGKPR